MLRNSASRGSKDGTSLTTDKGTVRSAKTGRRKVGTMETEARAPGELVPNVRSAEALGGLWVMGAHSSWDDGFTDVGMYLVQRDGAESSWHGAEEEEGVKADAETAGMGDSGEGGSLSQRGEAKQCQNGDRSLARTEWGQSQAEERLNISGWELDLATQGAWKRPSHLPTVKSLTNLGKAWWERGGCWGER